MNKIKKGLKLTPSGQGQGQGQGQAQGHGQAIVCKMSNKA